MKLELLAGEPTAIPNQRGWTISDIEFDITHVKIGEGDFLEFESERGFCLCEEAPNREIYFHADENEESLIYFSIDFDSENGQLTLGAGNFNVTAAHVEIGAITQYSKKKSA